jgi:hypothetical protein
MRDHQPIPLTAFNGLWARGWYDSNPLDHFSDCLNIKTVPNGFEVRDGFEQTFTVGSVLRQWVYKVFGQADRLLILDNNGSLWDSTNLLVPILTISGMTDFAAVSFGGRAYISPSNGITGLPGEKLYVYDGTSCRAAGGAAPSGGMTATEAATSGDVEAGFRIFAVAYETDTGFITAPGPAVFPTLTSTGGFEVTLSDIPTGPANVVARRLLATKLIVNYNGDQTGYQLFFIPNGRIPDNTTTTFNVSFFDAALLNDAWYLLDLFSEIPAMLWLNTYHGRIVGGGENANPSVVRVSEAGQPEAFNQVSGLLVVDPANTSSGVTNGTSFKDIFYLFKKDKTYNTADNNGVPSSWQVPSAIDEGIGADCHSIAEISDSSGVNIDKIIVAHQSGLIQFTGTYNRPEISWKIYNLWARINKKYFYTVQVAHDPTRQLIYCAVPLDDAIAPSHILVCDYSEIDPFAWNFYKLVRWYVWTLADGVVPTSIIVETSTTDATLMFRVGSSTGNVYTQVAEKRDDFSHAIPTPFIQSAILAIDSERGIQHINGIKLRIQGAGILTTTLYDKDKKTSSTLANLTLVNAPGREYDLPANFSVQGFMIKFGVSNYQEWFRCNAITGYAKQLYSQFPM